MLEWNRVGGHKDFRGLGMANRESEWLGRERPGAGNSHSTHGPALLGVALNGGLSHTWLAQSNGSLP